MDTDTVTAARAGDHRALDALIAGCLPLVYNIVGRALRGHADVDDVVQETMLRVVDKLPSLRDPSTFRSWLVTIAMHQVRDRHRRQVAHDTDPDDIADPGADFADLAIIRLRLSGQRQEVAHATRWLDADDRDLLSLWWLESAGELSREELASALGLTRQHAAVRVQRMKGQLDAARAVVRALATVPRCPDLASVLAAWDGRPSPLWRKRLARHTRECERCDRSWSELVAAERLLAGLPLVPLPIGLTAWQAGGGVTGAAAHQVAANPAAANPAAANPAAANPAGRHLVRVGRWAGMKPVVAAAVAALVIGGVSLTAYAMNNRAANSRTVANAAAEPARLPSLDPSPSLSRAASPAVPASAPPTTAKATAAAGPVAAPPIAAQSAKKGASLWSSFGGSSQALNDVKASWFYNWSADRGGVTAPAAEFVPMIWGSGSVNTATINKAKGQGKVLLGFNEPDLGSQSNMSVQQALDLWPQLMATGMRLGSPAPAFGAATAGSWFDQFMTGAKTRGYRVDFITLHWYGSDFSPAAVGQLKNYLQATYNRYHLPIWLTEYALINFSGSPKFPSDAQQAQFVTSSTAMMEGLSYMERYAWFALPSSQTGDTGLYVNGTMPTAAGVAYRAAGNA
jgi:RNA polymerase sigma factor (sigma-70 family)